MHLFKRRQPESIEKLLAEHRPAPRQEFARVLLERLGGQRRAGFGLRARPAGIKLVAAVGLTLLALVGATAAAGGVGAASHGFASFASLKHTFDYHSSNNDSKHGDKNSKGENGNKGDDEDKDHHNGPGDDQYKVKICHATGSVTNPYVLLTLSPQGAAQHLAHHPGDFLAPPWGCPGKPKKNH